MRGKLGLLDIATIQKSLSLTWIQSMERGSSKSDQKYRGLH